MANCKELRVPFEMLALYESCKMLVIHGNTLTFYYRHINLDA